MVVKRMVVGMAILIAVMIWAGSIAGASEKSETSRPKYVSGIKGTVRDANTGEPLPGANVILVGT
ncbi:MAG: carboxypeptidase-like regulatory domain-containing protein, partial [Calditrichaeota bacterium]|nr:carboxypeptidase-like regulatory domain-containing protein [Calditrichota bacterium]